MNKNIVIQQNFCKYHINTIFFLKTKKFLDYLFFAKKLFFNFFIYHLIIL